MIRLSIENLRRLGIEHMAYSRNNNSRLMMSWNPLHSMSPEDRRDFLQNILVSKTIVKKVTDEGDGRDALLDDHIVMKAPTRKTSLLLVDLMDDQSTTKEVSLEPSCSICMNDYSEGEILCWSQNSRCRHCFHRDCAIEWLMSHEECPLCRSNYLSLDEDGEGADGEDLSSWRGPTTLRNHNVHANEDASSLFQGMHLFYILSQLQTLANAATNPAVPVEGIELPSSRQGNVEDQVPTDDSALAAARPSRND
jgi:Ring finger domain